MLDTNVWLDLLWFRDPACEGLRHALRRGDVVAITREDCRDEWHRVLGYAALAIGDVDRQRLIAEFDDHVLMLDGIDDPGVCTLPRCADPDDQKFLELARDGGASWLLSRDRELLRLSRRLARAGLFEVLLPTGFRPPAPVGTAPDHPL